MTDLYPDSVSHILSELERVDLLLGVAVHRAQQFMDRDDRFQGLYIADEEVVQLLASPAGLPRWAREEGGRTKELEALRQIATSNRLRADATERSGTRLRMLELSHLFGLTPLESDVVLIAVAPELDLR